VLAETTSGELPVTGTSVTGPVTAAAGAIGLGGLLLGIRRRRGT
jgi:LPXTG-motif cell wall-anchored protein